MKKAERIATASSAVARVAAGVAEPALILIEIEKKVTGQISVNEAGKLVEGKRWTPETVEHAKSLGLVVEKVEGATDRPAGAGRVGNVAVQFAEKNGTLYNGTQPLDEAGENMQRKWISVYGLHAAFKIFRKAVKEADKAFNLGIYFFPSEKKEETEATGSGGAAASTE